MAQQWDDQKVFVNEMSLRGIWDALWFGLVCCYVLDYCGGVPSFVFGLEYPVQVFNLALVQKRTQPGNV